jgi:hypothetical protein
MSAKLQLHQHRSRRVSDSSKRQRQRALLRGEELIGRYSTSWLRRKLIACEARLNGRVHFEEPESCFRDRSLMLWDKGPESTSQRATGRRRSLLGRAGVRGRKFVVEIRSQSQRRRTGGAFCMVRWWRFMERRHFPCRYAF